MIPRGEPFRPDPRRGGRAVWLACPVCLCEGRWSSLVPGVVWALGPAEKLSGEALEPPFYRYKCEHGACGFVEIHLRIVQRP